LQRTEDRGLADLIFGRELRNSLASCVPLRDFALPTDIHARAPTEHLTLLLGLDDAGVRPEQDQLALNLDDATLLGRAGETAPGVCAKTSRTYALFSTEIAGWLVCREHDGLSRDHCRFVAKSVAIIPNDGIDNSFDIDSTTLLNLINYRAAENESAREDVKVSDLRLRL
jgi:hypothetical protein